MPRLSAALLLAAAFLAPAAGAAQVPALCGPVGAGPYAFVRVNALCVNLSNSIVFNPTTGLSNLNVTNLVFDGLARVNRLDVVFKRDPYVDFGVNTTNFLFDETSYAFYFGTPIDPGLYRRAETTGRVTVSRGAIADGITTQDGTAEYVTVYGSDGATLIPLGVDVGTGSCASGATSNTCSYPPPAGGLASNTFAPIFLDNLEVELVYRQDGLTSTADWSGRAEVFQTAAVPEPGTAALTLAGGAALLAGAAARRRGRGA